MTEKDFIRTFILELVLVEKDSVFDLDDFEVVSLPKNYLSIIDKLALKDNKCSILLSKLDRGNISKELDKFMQSNGVFAKEEGDNYEIFLSHEPIMDILSNKTLSSKDKYNISHLALEFIKSKSKAKTLTYK